MKLRSLVTAGAAAVGLTAVGNRLLVRRAGPLEPALSGTQHTYRWRGMNVAYTEAGDPDAPDLLLIHGIHAAASSREFDRIFDDLAEEYHVIAPDLPGFGRSDRPPLLYSGSLYSSFVADFARDVADEPTCIASSLSGAYAVEAAKNGDIGRLILVCPTTETMTEEQRPLVRSLLRTPLVGTALYHLLVSKRSIRHFNADHGYYDPDEMRDEKIEYQWRTAHQPGARFAPASFVTGFLDRPFDLEEELEGIADDVPTTLVWGREASINPLYEGRALAQAANVRLVAVDRARLLPHAEHPNEFVELVGEELRRAEHD